MMIAKSCHQCTTYAKQYDSVTARDNIYNYTLLERPSTMALLDDVRHGYCRPRLCGSGIYAQWFIDQGTQIKSRCTDLSQDMVTTW
ncbi:hypothetical protein O9992_01185 [Vibrio lentus]|nr:hypothetical protein [Vibrio lentus]